MKGMRWPFTLQCKIFTSNDELEEAVLQGNPDELVESKIEAVNALLRAQGIEVELTKIDFHHQEVAE